MTKKFDPLISILEKENNSIVLSYSCASKKRLIAHFLMSTICLISATVFSLALGVKGYLGVSIIVPVLLFAFGVWLLAIGMKLYSITQHEVVMSNTGIRWSKGGAAVGIPWSSVVSISFKPYRIEIYDESCLRLTLTSLYEDFEILHELFFTIDSKDEKLTNLDKRVNLRHLVDRLKCRQSRREAKVKG